jgi:hypothetical protein
LSKTEKSRAQLAKFYQKASICKYNSSHTGVATAPAGDARAQPDCAQICAFRSQHNNNYLPYGPVRMRSSNGEINEHERQQQPHQPLD